MNEPTKHSPPGFARARRRAPPPPQPHARGHRVSDRATAQTPCGLTDQNAHPQDIIELRRLLYGLYAVLRLHNAQEDESATPHTRQPSILELDAHLDRELRVNVSKTNLRGPKQELQYSGVRIPTIAGNVPQFRGDLLRRSDGGDNPGRS
jgi:hypothetical protein